jgi:hypothetical protein
LDVTTMDSPTCITRTAGHADTPIQAWPLMRRIGQLPPDVQVLAVKQISSLLDGFEVLSARITAGTGDPVGPQSHVAGTAWDPARN